jgi:hypothetical protein
MRDNHFALFTGIFFVDLNQAEAIRMPDGKSSLEITLSWQYCHGDMMCVSK